MKQFAVIWCCPVPGTEFLKSRLLQIFSRSSEQWDVLAPNDADFLSRAANYDGYVVSGSPKSVVEDAGTPLVDNVLAHIRNVREHSSAPIVGVCFGAQALAVALGGAVGKNPGGHFRLGVDRLAWAGLNDAPRWPEVSQDTALVQSHGECVLELPPGSLALASSATVPNELFLAQGRFLGIQGHPEVDNACLRHAFMPLHRQFFDDEQWKLIDAEAAQQYARPEPVIALARRLLDCGSL